MLQSVWFSNLPAEEQEEFKSLLKNSTRVLRRVRELIESRERGIEQFESSVDSYNNSAWAFKQAHVNGRKAELTELKKLFNFLDQRN